MKPKEWRNVSEIPSRRFKCGYCGDLVASNKGYYYDQWLSPYARKPAQGYAYICNNDLCRNLTVYRISNRTYFPSPSPYTPIDNLPKKIDKAFKEMCMCMAINAFTSVLLWRRLITMHVAIEQSSEDSEPLKEGLKFIEYGEYLAKNSIPKNASSDWLTDLRKLSNKANHTIDFANREEAQLMIDLVKALLNIYAYPKLKNRDKD